MTDDRRKLRDLTTITDIGLKLSSELDVDAVANMLAVYGSVLLEAQRTTLLLTDPVTGALELKTTWGWDPVAADEERLAEHAAALQAAASADAHARIVPMAERADYPYLDPLVMDEAIVVPVHGARSLVGVLIVEGRTANDPFGDYDGEILELLVAQAGIAIENARVYAHMDSLVEERTRELELAKAKSDQVLLNILPAEVLDELKERGRVMPRRHEAASILFTDFVGFTTYAENLPPEELIDDLETSYAMFDEIVGQNGMEKLKTIGDAYMCSAGVPVALADHAVRAVRAGLQMVEAIESLKEMRAALGQDAWDVRIGIHSGPLVAGIVGRTKFAYDVWGDSVNLASRMESHGVVNRVNISHETYELVQHRFHCEPRGEIPVKGHGSVPMYLVVAELADAPS